MEAERPYDLEETERLRADHRDSVLGVYDTMHASVLTHAAPGSEPENAVSFHDQLHLEIYQVGWPPEDAHEAEAVEDLESWPRAAQRLGEFRKAYEEAHEQSLRVLGDLRTTLRDFLGTLGLEPSNNEQGLGSVYHEAEVIRRAILQRVAEGDHYAVGFRRGRGGSICTVEDAKSTDDLVDDLSAEEAPRVIEAFERLPQKLDEFKRDRMFFAKLTGDILKLQVAFSVAKTNLYEFKRALEDARERLRVSSYLPGGGRCEVCQDLRRRAPDPETSRSGGAWRARV